MSTTINVKTSLNVLHGLPERITVCSFKGGLEFANKARVLRVEE